MRLLAVACALSVGVPLHYAAGQRQGTPPSPAKVWNMLDSLAKIVYVRGFADGATLTGMRVETNFQDPRWKERWFLAKPRVALRYDSAVMLDLKNLTDPPSAGAAAMVSVMDKLYSDPANVCVPWMVIYNAASRRLYGETSEEIDKYLSDIRNISITRRCEM